MDDATTHGCSNYGKGSLPRPRLIANEEYGIRFDLAVGAITREEFDRRMEELKQQGKFQR